MIELLTDYPDEILAVAGRGDVTADDYRSVLLPAALDKMKKHKHVSLFCQLGPDFKAFAPGAMWEDTKLLVSHWGVWGRVVIVTDKKWVAEAMRMFAPFFHHPVRVFPNRAAAEARNWIVESDAQAA